MRNPETTNSDGRDVKKEEKDGAKESRLVWEKTKVISWHRAPKPFVDVAHKEKKKKFRLLLEATRVEELDRLREVGSVTKDAMIEKERRYLSELLGDYMGRHPRIDGESRAEVVREMSLLAKRNRASRHALLLGVQILDRALRRVCGVVDNTLLAKMGTVALLIAVKYEHDDRFSLDEILDEFWRQEPDKHRRRNFELEMLSLVDYDCGVPTSLRFLEEWGFGTPGVRIDAEVLSLSASLLEIGLYWYEFQADHPPSLQAYSAVAFACHLLHYSLPKPFIELARKAEMRGAEYVTCFEKIVDLYRRRLAVVPSAGPWCKGLAERCHPSTDVVSVPPIPLSVSKPKALVS